MRLTLIDTGQPTKVGQPTTLFANLNNTGVSSERQVAVRVLIPNSFTVDRTAIQPRGSFEVVDVPEGLELRFTPIAELRAGEQQRYIVPLTPARAGVATVSAQVRSQSATGPTTKQREITIIDR